MPATDFEKLVFQCRFGVFKFQIHLVGIAHYAGLIFMAITLAVLACTLPPDVPV